MGGGALTTRALAPDDAPIVEALFGANGACGGCWCMFWRLRGAAFKEAKGDPNKAAFLELVRTGAASGVLAFRDGAAVGWCAVGPRAAFARIEAGPSYRREAPTGAWSLNCFFVPRAQRGSGVARALLDAAVAHAFGCGAPEVEAYPVVPGADAKLPAAFAYTGVASMFAAAGFSRVGETKIWVRRP